MTPKRIVAAYYAIRELESAIMPYKSARSVFYLKKRLAEEFEIVVSMEKSIAEKYGGLQDGRSYKFENSEIAKKFAVKLEAAMNQEASIQLPDVDLSDCANSLKISPSTLAALDGLIKFEEG